MNPSRCLLTIRDAQRIIQRPTPVVIDWMIRRYMRWGVIAIAGSALSLSFQHSILTQREISRKHQLIMRPIICYLRVEPSASSMYIKLSIINDMVLLNSNLVTHNLSKLKISFVRNQSDVCVLQKKLLLCKIYCFEEKVKISFI